MISRPTKISCAPNTDEEGNILHEHKFISCSSRPLNQKLNSNRINVKQATPNERVHLYEELFLVASNQQQHSAGVALGCEHRA